MKPKLSDLWRWDGTVSRGTYCFWGLTLFILKINCDRAFGWLWFGKSWTIFDWEQLRLYLWQTVPYQADRSYYLPLLGTSEKGGE